MHATGKSLGLASSSQIANKAVLAWQSKQHSKIPKSPVVIPFAIFVVYIDSWLGFSYIFRVVNICNARPFPGLWLHFPQQGRPAQEVHLSQLPLLVEGCCSAKLWTLVVPDLCRRSLQNKVSFKYWFNICPCTCIMAISIFSISFPKCPKADCKEELTSEDGVNVSNNLWSTGSVCLLVIIYVQQGECVFSWHWTMQITLALHQCPHCTSNLFSSCKTRMSK